MSPGLRDAINACMCMYALFVASGMHDQNDRSLSGALTLATFVAGQTLSGAVFRKLREIAPAKKNVEFTFLGVFGTVLGTVVCVYFGVYCAALTARAEDPRKPSRLPAAVNTHARATCDYHAVEGNQLSMMMMMMIIIIDSWLSRLDKRSS
jgi:hypothetical protein